MLYIRRRNTNPYFNIAAEEYVLKEFTQDCFMLWRNEASVIVGKHQNTLAEINLDFIEKNNIPVIRRISGGGTVFHDLGNLNFTFIKNGSNEKLVDFQKFTEPIIGALATLGIEAKFEGKNDLRVKGKKISGNAEHVHKNRVLHHGTLLFDSKLGELNESIKANESKFQDKAVKSNRSIVTNIIDHLDKKISIEEFEKRIFDFVFKSDPLAEFYEFTQEDIENINELVQRKYKTWNWNFGYSPKYNFSKTFKLNDELMEISLDIKDGTIKHVKILANYNKLDILEKQLIGTFHQKQEIEKRLSQIKLKDFNQTEFINGLF